MCAFLLLAFLLLNNITSTKHVTLEKHLYTFRVTLCLILFQGPVNTNSAESRQDCPSIIAVLGVNRVGPNWWNRHTRPWTRLFWLPWWVPLKFWCRLLYLKNQWKQLLTPVDEEQTIDFGAKDPGTIDSNDEGTDDNALGVADEEDKDEDAH